MKDKIIEIFEEYRKEYLEAISSIKDNPNQAEYATRILEQLGECYVPCSQAEGDIQLPYRSGGIIALKKLPIPLKEEPKDSAEEHKFGKRKKYQTITFPDNEIHYMQDHGFWKGLPANVEFVIAEVTRNDSIKLVAEGYGALHDNPYGLKYKYGNGAIYVLISDLPKNIAAGLPDPPKVETKKD